MPSGKLTLRRPPDEARPEPALQICSPKPQPAPSPAPAQAPAAPTDIERLQALLPVATFGPDAAVPLVADIARQIRCAMPKDISDLAIQRFISKWTRRPDYRAALERGEPRRNLDGSLPRNRQVDHVRQRELENLLASTWPRIFGDAAEPAPLVIGVHRKIREALRDEPCCTTKSLGIFLTRWVRRPAYLEAVAAGARRRNLDGSTADVPTESEREHAASELERRFGGASISDAVAAE